MGEMWETRSLNQTLLVLFLCQRLDINKNIKKKSHKHLHTEKTGNQQGELHQSIRCPESFQSEMIRFLLQQWDLIFLDSGLLQLGRKHHVVRLANPLLKILTYLSRDPAVIKACTSLAGPPCSHWDSNIALLCFQVSLAAIFEAQWLQGGPAREVQAFITAGSLDR